MKIALDFDQELAAFEARITHLGGDLFSSIAVALQMIKNLHARIEELEAELAAQQPADRGAVR